MEDLDIADLLILCFKKLGFREKKTACFLHFLETEPEMIEMIKYLDKVEPKTETEVTKKIVEIREKYHPGTMKKLTSL